MESPIVDESSPFPAHPILNQQKSQVTYLQSIGMHVCMNVM